MSVRTESPRWNPNPPMPLERDYLRKMWLVVAGIVVAAAAVLSFGLTSAGPSSTPDPTTPNVTRIVDGGPSTGAHTPIRIGDYVCGQCR
jgi:hypothetical protein